MKNDLNEPHLNTGSVQERHPKHSKCFCVYLCVCVCGWGVTYTHITILSIHPINFYASVESLLYVRSCYNYLAKNIHEQY